jgi:SNF family Na+-dependent transporter
MDNGPFLHWIVWAVATLVWCIIVHHQLRVSRPLAAVMVGITAFIVGYIKELTDVEFGVTDLWADSWGIFLGILMFFLLVRRRKFGRRNTL